MGADRYDGAMGAFDNAKDLTDKVTDGTEETVDKLDGVIEKVADKVDDKTGGKYSDKIDQVVMASRNPPRRPRGRKSHPVDRHRRAQPASGSTVPRPNLGGEIGELRAVRQQS